MLPPIFTGLLRPVITKKSESEITEQPFTAHNVPIHQSMEGSK